MKDFSKEIEKYSVDDLNLIIETQQELYSLEEMDLIKAILEKKIILEAEEREARIIDNLPETIICPKCDGPNSFNNDVCAFCGSKINKDIYYQEEYYKEDDYSDGYGNDYIEETQGNSYLFQYIISFIIPLVGFIMGAIMLTKEDGEKCACGKKCILVGVVSIIISVLVFYMV